ncbi:CaiB/BaiF CoA transferase family protein [Chloroflexota bacterium]
MQQGSLQNVFEGINVLDFGQVLAGPLTSSYLAKWGATVVRVESQARPDMTRTSSPFKDSIPGVNRSGAFTFNNANKYDITLELKHPKARSVINKLVQWAHIICENFTPGTMEQLGLGDENIRKLNPSVTVLHFSNQGQTGPQWQRRGFGIQLVAQAGFTNITGFPDGIPVCSWMGYTDGIVPRFAALALVAALMYRRRTGKGVCFDLSQLETSLHFLAPLLLDREIHGREPKRVGNSAPDAAPHGAYRCQGDDRWLAISVHNGEEWKTFCQALDKPEWLSDPRFATFLDRKKNEDELNKLIEECTIHFSAEQSMKLLQEKGVPSGVVQNHKDLLEDPQLNYRGYWWWLDHKEIGAYPHFGTPFLMSETPAKPSMPAPLLGEHNEYVCVQLLKMPDEEFVEFFTEGVFGNLV